MAKKTEAMIPPSVLSIEIEPMEARLAESLPEGEGWSYEPKWDGFRCLAFKNGSEVDIRAKSGKPSWVLCCSGSTTRTASSLMSASHREYRILTDRN